MILGTPKTILAKSIFTDEGVDAKTSMIFEYDKGQVAKFKLFYSITLSPIEQLYQGRMDG